MNEWHESGLIEENERIEIEKVLRFLWLMWAGCLGTVPAFLFVSLTIARQLREDIMVGADLPRGVLSIFLIWGLGFPVTAYFMRKRFLAGNYTVFEKRAAEIATRTNKPVYLVRYRVGAYLPMVMSTAPAICGFGVYVFGGDNAIFCLLLGIAALSIAYHRPKRGEIIAMIGREKAKDRVS